MDGISYREPANDGCLVRRATFFDRAAVQFVLDGCALAGEAHQDLADAESLLTNQVVYVAFIDQRPVGLLAASRATATVLNSLVVLPGGREKGHACALIGAALNELSLEEGIDTSWAAVDPDLPGAHQRYLNHCCEDVDANCGRFKLMMRGAHRAPALEMPSREATTRVRATG